MTTNQSLSELAAELRRRVVDAERHHLYELTYATDTITAIVDTLERGARAEQRVTELEAQLERLANADQFYC